MLILSCAFQKWEYLHYVKEKCWMKLFTPEYGGRDEEEATRTGDSSIGTRPIG